MRAHPQERGIAGEQEALPRAGSRSLLAFGPASNKLGRAKRESAHPSRRAAVARAERSRGSPWSASVPLAQVMQCFRPVKAASCPSSSLTYLPPMNAAELRTTCIFALISSLRASYWAFKSMNCMTYSSISSNSWVERTLSQKMRRASSMPQLKSRSKAEIFGINSAEKRCS